VNKLDVIAQKFTQNVQN